MQIKLTKRDAQIIETLAHRVRFFTLEQIARTWWAGNSGEESKAEQAATRRLRRLVAGDWLARRVVSVPPELELKEPVFCWSPGAAEPNYYQLAWAVQKRWKELPRATEIYEIATEGLRKFGGRAGGPKRLTQIRHDLHIGTVYLALVAENPEAVNRWVSEDELAKERQYQKLPDGLLRATSCEPEVAIEFAGAYDAGHLQSFHDDCVTRQMHYQIW